MFAASKTNTPSGGAPDPQFNYVTMLLHGDGTNGAQNNTFLDSSTNNFTITRNGNTTQGSFSPYGSNWSNYFGGTGNYLTTATSASGFSFGTGDFTIEFWINSTQTTRCDPIGQNNTFSSSGWWGLIANLSSSGQLQWFENTNSRISATATNWNNGSWNHIAVTRSGNSVRMFVNGTQVGSTYTTSFTYGDSSVGVIAGVLSDDKTTGPLTGYLSNFRIVKGTALYTGTFTPSTTPLTAVSGTSLLTCQSNRFIDNSSNSFTITATGTPSVQRFNPFGASTAYSTSVIGGSGYFDGSGDYLTTTMTGGLGSGDFTVEIWVYATSVYNYITWFATTRDANGFSCGTDANGALVWVNGVGGTSRKWDGATTAGNIIRVNSWNHVAFVRSSNTMRVYLNGVATVTTSSASSVSDTANYSNTNLNIGRLATGGPENPTGYLCDGRITTSALYTSNFTPPTAPLTAVSGVRLLNNYTNGAIFDNAMMNDLETVGNAQISTSVVKYGTGSLAFDGTGDYLTGPSTPAIALGSGAYTVEFWLYKDSTGSGERGIFQTQTASLYGLSIFADGTTIYIDERTNSFNGSDPRISGTISQDTWIHVAVCRQTGTSGTLRVFVNGTQIGSSVTSNLRNLTSAGPIIVGNTAVATNPLKGYIDDFRITNGYARYTANFTAPTAAFPNIGPN